MTSLLDAYPHQDAHQKSKIFLAKMLEILQSEGGEGNVQTLQLMYACQKFTIPRRAIPRTSLFKRS
jgi:hypothetical protein